MIGRRRRRRRQHGHSNEASERAASLNDMRGSYRLMYSKLGKSDTWLFAPGFLLSFCAGVVPSLASKVIGSAFNAFTAFNLAKSAAKANSQADQAALHQAQTVFMSNVRQSIWQLCAIGLATLALSTVMLSCWIVIGERVARGWRLFVYDQLATRDMTWFESQLPLNVATPEAAAADDDDDDNHQGSNVGGRPSNTSGVGAGGLMAKFARETDEVRIASSQTMGQIMESLATMVASLIIAFISCWSLSLVVLSITPLMMVAMQFFQRSAIKWHLLDMDNMARAGKIIEQSVEAIATVKALTIEQRQAKIFMQHIGQTVRAWNKLAVIYGTQYGLMSGSSLLMFAGGFWYGSYLVQAGKYSTGDVFTTFWSCLTVSGLLAPIVQKRAILEAGKVSAASLARLTLLGEDKKRLSGTTATLSVNQRGSGIDPFDSADSPSSIKISALATFDELAFVTAKQKPLSAASDTAFPVSPVSATFDSPRHRLVFGRDATRPTSSARLQPMRRIWPEAACLGEVQIQHLTFAYPSRPNDIVLRDVSMFLPSGDFTFVLGQSGSGKSTISHLLLGLYADYKGKILLDDQDLKFVDPSWTQANVAGIDQSPIIFDMSIHDNVALGMCGRLEDEKRGKVRKANHVPYISRARVKEACRMALLDQDIRLMPDGYNTLLGVGGVDLSGGQKQRLALARAIVRDPTVLILDEATSALDITNRTLVMALIRRWRKGKTTIVITHDFSQIQQEDFVYMLEEGELVEQGYRMDLEQKSDGKFVQARMAARATGDNQSSQNDEAEQHDDVPSPTGLDWGASRALHRHSGNLDDVLQRQQRAHVRASRWAFNSTGYNEVYSIADQWQREKTAETIAQADVQSEIMLVHPVPPPSASRSPARPNPATMHSRMPSHTVRGAASAINSTLTTPESEFTLLQTFGRPSHQRQFSSASSVNSTTTLGAASTTSQGGGGGLRPLRLAQEQQMRTMREQGTDVSLALTSVAVSQRRPDQPIRKAWTENELDDYTVSLSKFSGQDDDDDSTTNEQQAATASRRKCRFCFIGGLWNGSKEEGWIKEIEEDADDQDPDSISDDKKDAKKKKQKHDTVRALFALALRVVWKYHPRRWILLAGLFTTSLASAILPCFSYVLGRLLATMGARNQQSAVLPLSLGVMGLALIDCAGQMLRFMLLQIAANVWIENVRRCAVDKMFSQDKSWFDKEENSSSMLLIRLVRDPEDAKGFISRIIGEVLIIVSILIMAFIWALAQCWQLTLAGLASGPVFYLAVSLQAKAILYYERQNKLQRERVSKQFYTAVHHAREIRSMGLQDVFRQTFHDAVRYTYVNGIRAAPATGLGEGVREACINFAQAFLYYIGAVLLMRDQMTLQQMFIVNNLILFGVGMAASVLSYLPSVSKSLKALQDVHSILQLDERSASDHSGYASPRIQGGISLQNVSFAYPNRPDKLVLDNCSFDVAPGERVALVGSSGCGKSTIAALLQRMYEPSQPGGGVILLDDHWPLHSIVRHHLRSQLACVAQRSDLFDDSVRANILLAQPTATEHRIRQALELACCDTFVDQLPDGMDTSVGERASNISGGQKQRLAIARALVRDTARIRILDECTSALDPQNQESVASNLLDIADDVEDKYRSEQHSSHSSAARRHHAWYEPRTTTIIVTHKLELMKRCDRILVLDKGKVAQEGTFEQLIRQKGGVFSKLANAGEWGA